MNEKVHFPELSSKKKRTFKNFKNPNACKRFPGMN